MYKIKNISDAKIFKKTFDNGRLIHEAFELSGLNNIDGALVKMTLNTGQNIAYYPEQNQFAQLDVDMLIYVIKGELIVKFDDEKEFLIKNQGQISLPRGQKYRFIISRDVEVYAACTPPFKSK